MGRKYLFVVVATLIVALTPMSSKSETSEKYDVQKLREMCRKVPTPSVDAAFCVGFVGGLAEHMYFVGAFVAEQLSHGRLADFDDRILVSFFAACSTATVSRGAMVQVFVNWADKHPEKWDMSMQLGVMTAIREAWPCNSDFRAK